MRTVITIVGISLLSTKDQRPWASWRPGIIYPTRNTVSNWLRVAEYTKASAEINMWHKLGIIQAPENEKVILIHSKTEDSKHCAECLRDFAETKYLEVEIKQIDELTYSNFEMFNHGLSRFVRVLAQTIQTAKSYGEVAIAATGDFKAEMAIANLVGSLLGASVYYIYEQFEKPVKFEPIPIILDPLCLRDNAKDLLLKKFDGAYVPSQDIESLMKTDGHLELLMDSVKHDGQNTMCSNVLGELVIQLLKNPRAEWPSMCNTPPYYKIKLQEYSYYPRPDGWEKTVDQLSKSHFIKFIRYDDSAGNVKGIRPIKNNYSDIHVVLDDGKYILGLRLETTSENAAQYQLLIDHFRKQLGF